MTPEERETLEAERAVIERKISVRRGWVGLEENVKHMEARLAEVVEQLNADPLKP